MNRKNFIINACTACAGAAILPGLFSSCKTTLFTSGTLTSNGIMIDVREFALKEKGKHRLFIVVRNEALLFPICVYRFNEKEYTAIWMQCSHQGAELNVAGNYLQCPAHGSEYDSKGQVSNGPADRDLRTFPVSVTNQQLLIDLRKI